MIDEELCKSDIEILEKFTDEEIDEIIAYQEPLENDIKFEHLTKACPRCGKPSANKSNHAGRCSNCLKKLKANRHKPGHYMRSHYIADAAVRRQDGKNGTASKKSSGRGSHKEIVDKIQRAEKKTGQKLSPDRKDNSKGYSSKNTRMVKPELNRGRHTVDPKKLAAWRKKLKKSELDVDDLLTLLKAKAYENDDNEMIELLNSIDENDLDQFINE